MKLTDTANKRKSRRDERRNLGPGEGVLRVAPDAAPVEGRLSHVGLSGLGATFDADPGLQVRGEPVDAMVELNGLVIYGDLIVVNRRPGAGTEVRIGAMFCPRTAIDDEAWLTVTPPSARSGGKARESGDESRVLLIRCGSCHRTIALGESCEEGGHTIAECGHCSQQHILPGLDLLRLPASTKQLRSIARENRIDLPAAYSVMLGILTEKQVRDRLGPEPEDAAPAAAIDADVEAPDPEAALQSAIEAAAEKLCLGPAFQSAVETDAKEPGLDPTFHSAAETGSSTAAQASQRGSRTHFAEKLVDRHRLTETVALDVADNRTSATKTIRERSAGEPIRADVPVVHRSTTRRTLTGAALFFVALLAAAIALERWLPASRDADGARLVVPPRSSIDSSTFHRDHLGRVDEISADSPLEVLLTYCAVARDGAPYSPVEISPAVPPQDHVRLGIFRDSVHGGSKQAIRIWRGSDSEIWFAGGEGEPVPVISASSTPPRAED